MGNAKLQLEREPVPPVRGPVRERLRHRGSTPSSCGRDQVSRAPHSNCGSVSTNTLQAVWNCKLSLNTNAVEPPSRVSGTGPAPRPDTISLPEFVRLQQDLLAVHDALFFLKTASLSTTQRNTHHEVSVLAKDALDRVSSVKYQFLKASTRTNMLQVSAEIAELRSTLERAADGTEAMRALRKRLDILRRLCADVPMGTDSRRRG